MKWVRFFGGWLGWHLRAGFWYLGLAFRLYFAVGLDRDFHPDREPDMSRHFRCPYPRSYRQNLS